MNTPYTNSHGICSGFNETAFGSADRTDASAPPEPPNEGGTAASQEATMQQTSDDPRLVIRGESLNNISDIDSGESSELFAINGKAVLISTPLPKIDGEPYSAITDFLNCTFPFKEFDLDSVIFDLVNCLGSSFSPVKNRFKGLHGWQQSIQLGESKTFFAYGGQNNTAFISIPAEGCHMVSSWVNLMILLRDKFKAKITRWDGAVDDYYGIYNVDLAVKLYEEGMFNAGGKTPSCNQIGNWLKPDGSGRTFYVGKRKNGKMLRVYEKGMQLGAKFHPWVRWELELHSRDRIIPFDVLMEPGKYVAGSYPNATSWIQEKMERIKTLQNTTKISYDFLTACASQGYGKHINVMLEIEGTAEKVIEKLIRKGIPRRLDIPIIASNEGW
jgi:phage replication initiation protein